MNPSYLLVSVFILLFSCLSCSEQKSPEESLKAYITDVEEKIEQKSVSGIKKLISEDYQDSYNHNKREILRILSSYFIRNNNLYLTTRIHAIELGEKNSSAKVVVYASISNVPVENDFQLLRSNIHYFHFQMQQEGKKWLLVSTEWKRATPEDFFKK